MKNTILRSSLLIYSILLFGACSSNETKQESKSEAKQEPKNVMTDSRDGREYQITTIDGRVWMAENLAYVPNDNSYILLDEESKWAKLTKDEPAYCYYENSKELGFGCLYSFDAALTACPDGWHLPNNDDWMTLRFMGAKNLASKEGWAEARYSMNGFISVNPERNNSSGFNGKPYGSASKKSNKGSWYKKKEKAIWWSSYRDNMRNLQYAVLEYNDKSLKLGRMGENSDSFIRFHSVRCIKDILR